MLRELENVELNKIYHGPRKQTFWHFYALFPAYFKTELTLEKSLQINSSTENFLNNLFL